MEIENSVAIITGGASGLGEATVRSLNSKNCKVCIFDNNIEKGEAIAKELGKNVAFFKVDVCNTKNVQKSMSFCQRIWIKFCRYIIVILRFKWE